MVATFQDPFQVASLFFHNIRAVWSWEERKANFERMHFKVYNCSNKPKQIKCFEFGMWFMHSFLEKLATEYENWSFKLHIWGKNPFSMIYKYVTVFSLSFSKCCIDLHNIQKLNFASSSLIRGQ